ncbi:MAG: hypothetical protein WBI14_06430 [Anaerolineaceae bacterium]
MFKLSSKQMIIIGVVLLLAGVVLPLLMVAQIIPSTYFLNFFAYGCSLVGMIMGFFGLFSFVKVRRDRIKRDKDG